MNALTRIHPAAAQARAEFHAGFVQQVATAVTSHPVVVVGMDWNPVVRDARRFLQEKEIAYHYIGHGNYLTGWKPRLAIKIWSGWPTFPQIFVHGMLIGGLAELKKLMEAGELARMLANPPA